MKLTLLDIFDRTHEFCGSHIVPGGIMVEFQNEDGEISSSMVIGHKEFEDYLSTKGKLTYVGEKEYEYHGFITHAEEQLGLDDHVIDFIYDGGSNGLAPIFKRIIR